MSIKDKVKFIDFPAIALVLAIIFVPVAVALTI
jgi:hypothetical protein